MTGEPEPAEPGSTRVRRIAALLSCETFEAFYGKQLGLDRESYLATYRNDWSWFYSEHLREFGIEVLVYLPTAGDPGSVRTHDGHLVRFVPVGRRTLRMVERLRPVRRTPPVRWLFEVWMAWSMWGPLAEALDGDGADVLYVQEYWTGRFDFLALRSHVALIGADHGGRARRQFRVLKSCTFRRARVLTAQTHDEASQVLRRGGRAMVLGNAVDTRFFSPAASPGPSDAVVLLHVARLVDHHKRTSLVLRSLPHLPREWRLVIVGSGPDELMLRQLTTELGVEQRVDFRGFVTDRVALREAYRAATVLVQPSSREARLLVALEAMACGTPCVLTDLPAFREMVTDGRDGVIVEPTPESVAHGVAQVVKAGPVMRRRARATVQQQHSWDATGPAFRAMVERCLGQAQ